MIVMAVMVSCDNWAEAMGVTIVASNLSALSLMFTPESCLSAVVWSSC